MTGLQVPKSRKLKVFKLPSATKVTDLSSSISQSKTWNLWVVIIETTLTDFRDSQRLKNYNHRKKNIVLKLNRKSQEILNKMSDLFSSGDSFGSDSKGNDAELQEFLMVEKQKAQFQAQVTSKI